MRASEIMSKEVAFVTPTETIGKAAKIMQEEDVGMLPVVESEDQMKVVGVITDRDIAIRALGEGRGREEQVQRIMSNGRVVCCGPEDGIDKIAHTMGTEQVRRIPVVDERGGLLGIVSQADLAIRAQPEKTAQTLGQISQPGGAHNQ